MTKEELKQKAEEYLHKDGTESEKLVKDIGMLCLTKKQLNGIFAIFKQIYIDSAEPREKRISELEHKISILLSCKNCPENKGGFICVKEYENKCLTQKIQYIKELQEEVAELKGIKDVATLIRANNDTVITLMQLNNKLVSKSQQLTKAKKLLKEFKRVLKEHNLYHNDLYKRTEQFLSEVEE